MSRTPPECAVAMLLLAVCGACADKKPPVPATAGAATHCLPGGDGFLRARLRGAIDADIDWNDAAILCEGGTRPDGKGIRVAFAGMLPPAAGAAPRHLRFVFGIDLADSAAGTAQVLPTNLTVIVEGEKLLFATLGDEKCASERLDRRPLPAGAGKERVQVRGYCTEPANAAVGDQRLLVSTFDFAGVINTDGSP